MEYQEYMSNLRQAYKTIKKLVPEVTEIIAKRALQTKDEELNILLMSDERWFRLQEKYEETAPRLYRFNPEEEYGTMHIMWPQDMRGDER